MATRFELVLCGAEPARLRAAGEEALQEIERLDSQLSLYRPESDITRINRRAATAPVRVEPRLFRLLQLASEISEATDGAFDVTIAPIMRAWGFVGAEGKIADPAELEAARAVVGMKHIVLDETAYTVGFDIDGLEIDLGAIGKGYAIERAAESLQDSGVTSALINGGTSSVHAIGSPPGQAAWRVALERPESPKHGPRSEGPRDDSGFLSVVDLCDSSLGMSGLRGKFFTDGGVEYGHVIDPRTGRPAGNTLAAAVTGPSATLCDALSTALLVLGQGWIPKLREKFPGYEAFTA